jgi:hypothetical protein
MSLITPDPNANGGAGSQQNTGQQNQGGAGSQNNAGAAGGNSTFDFRALLPEDIRTAATFEPFAKVKDQAEFTQQMARSYHSAQGLLGKKGLQVPGEGATPEQISEFHKALGVPEKAEDYKFTLPDGYKADESRIGEWRKQFKELGIAAKQADKLVGAYLKEEANALSARDAQFKAWENESRQSFGDKLPKVLNEVNYALKEVDPQGELTKLLEQSGFGNNQHVIRALSTLGATLAEKGPRGSGSGVTTNLTPSQAQAEIAQFERSSREALYDANHADHAYAVKRRAELYAAAFPPQ